LWAIFHKTEVTMRSIRAHTADLKSSLADFCEGALDPSRYIVAVNAAAAKVPQRFGHDGSKLLDGIHAFDMAETAAAYLGQTNLIQVSSFCGPGGLIWGYDLARVADLDRKLLDQPDASGHLVPVYDAAPLIEASKALLGTATDSRFRILPGSLCPAAYKSTTIAGPARCFAAFGLGIVEDRAWSACIFMEDVGSFACGGDLAAQRGQITGSMAASVLAVAANQGLRCASIYVACADIDVAAGEVGCALVAAPYLRLAGNAWPRDGLRRLRQMTLDDWLSECG